MLFDHAVEQGRIFVTNDGDFLALGAEWLRSGRSFPGLVYWHEEDYAAMTTGDFLRAFEALAALKDPFAYPIQFITPTGARRQLKERFKRPRRKRRR